MNKGEKIAEQLYSAEEIFSGMEAEKPYIKEFYSCTEKLEGRIQRVCGDELEEYAELQTKLQYEISKYSFMHGVKVGMTLKEL